MSPELEALLEAMYNHQTAEPHEQERYGAVLERMIEEALLRRPGLSRRQLVDALRPRYVAMLRARRKPPTLPSRA